MFNQQQANDFLQMIFKDFFEKGDVDLISKIYHKDVVGHYNQATFSYTDIEKRIRLLNEFCPNRKKFEVKEFYIIDNIIIGTCRQTWLTPGDSRLCETVICFTYRIVDNMVKEAWSLNQSSEFDYIDVNNKFEEFLNRYEISTVGKDSFFKILKGF